MSGKPHNSVLVSIKYEQASTKDLDITEFNKVPDVSKLVSINKIFTAYKKIKKHTIRTPLQKNNNLSEKFEANIYLKREDLQLGSTYKIRGVLNKIVSFSELEKELGIVAASAGNHARSVALASCMFKIHSSIFVPKSTSKLKIQGIQQFFLYYNPTRTIGKEFVQVFVEGESLEECQYAALTYSQGQKKNYIHAFDDDEIITGQGSIAIEILEDIPEDKIDFIIFPVGGGSAGAGLCSYFKQVSPQTILIGCEPSLKKTIDIHGFGLVEEINTFDDGTNVQLKSLKTEQILNQCLKELYQIPEGHVCSIMMKLFNEEGILVEPAGALSIGVLDQIKDIIKGKNIVCLISGANSDLSSLQDIRMLSEMYKELQYYLLVNFYMKPGALKQFFVECIGPTDEITNIEYTRKSNREKGPALVGIRVKQPEDFKLIKQRLDDRNITFRFLKYDQELFNLLL